MNAFIAAGYLATFCICVTQIPQIVKIIRTHDVQGLSLPTYLIYDFGNASGLLYGLYLRSVPVTLTSIVTLIASLTATFLIVHWRGNRRMQSGASDEELIRLSAALSYLCPHSDHAYAVGAVVADRAGNIISTGYSREFGPAWHAEEVAIYKARARGASLKEAVLFSSLEPCGSRRSRPTCCAQAIIDAGITRVLFSANEPPILASGRGAEKLSRSGVRVTKVDLVAQHVDAVNAHITRTPYLDEARSKLRMGLQYLPHHDGESRYILADVGTMFIAERRPNASPSMQSLRALNEFCEQHIDEIRTIADEWDRTRTFPHKMYGEWVQSWGGHRSALGALLEEAARNASRA